MEENKEIEKLKLPEDAFYAVYIENEAGDKEIEIGLFDDDDDQTTAAAFVKILMENNIRFRLSPIEGGRGWEKVG